MLKHQEENSKELERTRIMTSKSFTYYTSNKASLLRTSGQTIKDCSPFAIGGAFYLAIS